MTVEPVRLLAIVEARTVTGPARNLFEFCRIARELEGRRVETVIVTWRRRDQPAKDEFLDAAHAAGIEVEVVDEKSALDRDGPAALRRIVAGRDPDVVQTHAVKSHFLLRLSRVPLWKSWVAFHHGYTYPDIKMRAYNLLDRWSLQAPQRIVTVSRAFADQLTERGISPKRIVVLHNAIAPDWLAQGGISRAEARRRLGIASDRHVVLAVGRLSREKAFDRLLSAFVNQPGDPLLLIVGEGPEKSNLERRIAALGLTGRVRLEGQIRQMHPYYAAADVVAISSVTEGSPNVLLEAMAAHVPVVATAVGGIPEIVSDQESALLVAPGNSKALTDALVRALSARDEALARAARAHALIMERYSPQARTRRLVELYTEVLAP
jgi:glycosyltransferase involved in cell wall biosynthesis